MSTELNLQDIEISVETITERFGGGEDVKELEKEANALKDRMNLGYNPTRDFSAERKRVYERVIDLLKLLDPDKFKIKYTFDENATINDPKTLGYIQEAKEAIKNMTISADQSKDAKSEELARKKIGNLSEFDFKTRDRKTIKIRSIHPKHKMIDLLWQEYFNKLQSNYQAYSTSDFRTEERDYAILDKILKDTKGRYQPGFVDAMRNVLMK